MDDAVLGKQYWACHCWMLEYDCVGDKDMLGGVFEDFVASIMLERRAYVESDNAAEISRALGGPICV